MSLKSFAVCLALSLPALAARADDVERLGTYEAKAYPLIIPGATDVQWRSIPWLTDLDEAVAAAKREKRPLLLWTAGDDPLERC